MVTVVMPVRNGEKYIKESVESVLKQTYEDFEFIIIDDGSTDKTVSVIESYSDRRIRLVRQEHDFVGALNKGLQLAEGEFIARMDADDVMHTERLRIQVKRMTLNPEITVLSSWAKAFRDDGLKLQPMVMGDGTVENPVLEFLMGDFVIHPSVMIRKSFLRTYHLEYPDYIYSEDFKLWFEVAKLGGKFYIEPQMLMNYRVSENQITNTKRDAMTEQTVRIKREILDYLITEVYSSDAVLQDLYRNMKELENRKLFSPNETFNFFYTVLKKQVSLLTSC